MTVAETDAARRSSIEKRPLSRSDSPSSLPSAFGRLPDEIIQQILEAADPNGFASLVLLNSKWRAVSQQAHLYADHLSHCPSYAASHKAHPFDSLGNDLPKLRRAFAREVKRNLFDAYLRPKQTVIKLISNSISSSSCPGGEGIQFRASPKGSHILAYNSSRIYVIDVRGDTINVKRELRILRRPAATCINDEGTMLVVLLTEMQVDVYDLKVSPPKRTQSTILDNSPRAIALSPCCSVLATAYEGGIEVSSLAPNAIAADRRAVKCDPVDALAFSFDGTQILGTTLHSSQPNTVILTAPYYDPGSHMADDGSDISALWTTSILFPNSTRDCSHAALLQNGRYEEAAWTFTYDRSFETFRAVRIDDLRNGTTYFTGPIPSSTSQCKLLPCTLPAPSYGGDLVSAGFQGKEVWLYGIPEDLDAVPDTSNPSSENGSSSSGLNRRSSGPSIRPSLRSQDSSEAARLPKWQILCDKFRNTFVSGCKITELDGVSTAKWVADFGDSPLEERLVIAARGVLPPKPITEEDGIDFVDGGRIALVDFDYGLTNGRTTEITIEVGTKEPETLEEEHRDIDTEVAIVRRRTVAQRNKGRTAVLRAASTAAHPPPPLPSQRSSSSSRSQDPDADDDPLVPRRIGAPTRSSNEPAVAEGDETESIIEEQEALDAPYSHASPRSGTTLRRAATAAAANRRLHPSPPVAGRVQYRRADGRTEHPHESDADNWVPPPPPYQKEDPGDLPAFLRHAGPPVIPGTAPRVAPPPVPQQQPGRSQTAVPIRQNLPPPTQSVPPQSTSFTSPPFRPGPSSFGSSGGPGGPGIPGGNNRPTSSRSRYLDGDNIYDVSPPGTPRAASNIHHGRSPSSARTASNNSTMRRISEVSVVSPTSPDTNQRTLPAVPPIQTTAPPIRTTTTAVPQPNRAPTFNTTFSSQASRGMMPPTNMSSQAGSLPAPRPLSNAQTWSVEPSSTGRAPIPTAPLGYPYSAPPVNVNANQRLNQALPPAPRPEQLASLNNRPDQPSHRLSLSGGSILSQATVSERSSLDHSVRRSYRQSSHQSLPQQAQTAQQQWGQPESAQREPRPSTATLPLHQPQARRSDDTTSTEDMPLIISTPRGVTGAYDPPVRRSSNRRAETPIFAPVPRPGRPSAQSILRPVADRSDNPYNTAQGSLGGNNHYNNNNNTYNYYPAPASSSAAQPVPMHQNYLLPPPHPHATAAAGGSSRVPSLNRKQSRAGRSAAKNIADAKRRGWTGGRGRTKRRKKDKREDDDQDFDAASSAAWTDVTTASVRSGRFATAPPFDRGLKANSGGRADGQKEKKCAVM